MIPLLAKITAALDTDTAMFLVGMFVVGAVLVGLR